MIMTTGLNTNLTYIVCTLCMASCNCYSLELNVSDLQFAS